MRTKEKKLVNESELLTKRQREVLQLLAEGKAMKEVGAILYLTPRTVAYHKYRIMEVLDVTSNAELLKYAFRNHMVAAYGSRHSIQQDECVLGAPCRLSGRQQGGMAGAWS